MGEKKASHAQEVADAPAAPALERKAVEVWATTKGYLPQWQGGSAPAAKRDPRVKVARLVAGRGPLMNPEYWKFAAAKALCVWVEGQETTEAEFDAAIVSACSQRIG